MIFIDKAQVLNISVLYLEKEKINGGQKNGRRYPHCDYWSWFYGT